MNEYFQIIVISLVSGLFAMTGAIAVFSSQRTARIAVRVATPFAAGTLLGAAFFDLLPEALEHGAELSALRWTVVGMVSFFILEQSLDWFHHHHEHEHTSSAVVPLVMIGDTLHNLLDGIVIGAAFVISPSSGLITAVAVAAHEIPQEMGDFSLMVKHGLSRGRVVLLNALSALAAVVGAVVTFGIGDQHTLPMEALLGLAAGMFIYIAASDLIPTIHTESQQKFATSETLLLISGLLLIGIVTSLAH